MVDFDDYDKVVDYGQTGRVHADDADEGVLRAAASSSATRASASRRATKYPWDGVSGVRPFHEIAATTTVGVY